MEPSLNETQAVFSKHTQKQDYAQNNAKHTHSQRQNIYVAQNKGLIKENPYTAIQPFSSEISAELQRFGFSWLFLFLLYSAECLSVS